MNLPGDLLVSPEDAAALTADAASLTSLTLSAFDAGRLDIVMLGALPTPFELPAPPNHASGETLALRDTEGVLLALMGVTAVIEGGVRGEVAPLRRPTRPDHRELWRAPEPYEPGAVAVVATTPPLAEDLDDLLTEGPAIVLVLAGTDPLDPLHHARVAAWRALTESRGLPLVLLPLEAATEAEALQLAAAYGATRGVADPLEPDPALQRHGTGVTVFFTGLSGSGKSTVAALLAVRLAEAGRTVTLLDGDVVRTHLSAGLGFSKADRETNIRRIGFVAAEVTKHGGVAICAPIAPYAATRAAARAMVERYGRFVLVHVSTPLEVCEARDRKGLYAKARAGLLTEFTGISDPYEVPLDAEVTLDTTEMDVDEAVRLVLGHMALG
ncbi:MAG: sulfate adenylyltransferase [Frankiales bacterium]|nr:sulfate adenylyltransferase [Frankiales bacterium]